MCYGSDFLGLWPSSHTWTLGKGLGAVWSFPLFIINRTNIIYHFYHISRAIFPLHPQTTDQRCCFTNCEFHPGDPGADRGADGNLGQEEKRWRRGERGGKENSSTPLPLRRRFSSRPSFSSAPQSVPGSPKMVSTLNTHTSPWRPAQRDARGWWGESLPAPVAPTFSFFFLWSAGAWSSRKPTWTESARITHSFARITTSRRLFRLTPQWSESSATRESLMRLKIRFSLVANSLPNFPALNPVYTTRILGPTLLNLGPRAAFFRQGTPFFCRLNRTACLNIFRYVDQFWTNLR